MHTNQDQWNKETSRSRDGSFLNVELPCPLSMDSEWIILPALRLFTRKEDP